MKLNRKWLSFPNFLTKGLRPKRSGSGIPIKVVQHINSGNTLNWRTWYNIMCLRMNK